MNIFALNQFERWSLALTATYDLLTLLLLCAALYEAFVKTRLANLAFNVVQRSADTKLWSWQAATMDFVLENRGSAALNNVRITSEPDDIGWGKMKAGEPGAQTSNYFATPISSLDANERHQLFWCEATANVDALNTPFKIIVEFDNPVLGWIRKRSRREFVFDLRAWKSVMHGMNEKFDIHNVALELARIRTTLEEALVRLDDKK